MLQSDYLDLLGDEATKTLAGSTYGVCEYIDTFRLDENIAFDEPAERLTYHATAIRKQPQKITTPSASSGVLATVSTRSIRLLWHGRQFRLRSRTRSMSDAIASILYEQVDDSDGDRAVAPGAPVAPNSRPDRPARSRQRQSNWSQTHSSSRSCGRRVLRMESRLFSAGGKPLHLPWRVINPWRR